MTHDSPLHPVDLIASAVHPVGPVASVVHLINLVASAVHPLRLSTWGELAISFFTQKVVVCSDIYIPLPEEFDLVVQKLLDAGFRSAPWSFILIADPKSLRPSKTRKELVSQFALVDENSVRFQYPEHVRTTNRVVLMRSDYVDLCPPRSTDDVDATKFIKPDPNAGIYYPTKPVLLESFVRTLLKHSRPHGAWRRKLETWTIAYLYDLTDVSEDALDGCRSDVKEWYRDAIEPIKAYRGIISKRVGRLNLGGPFDNVQKSHHNHAYTSASSQST